MFARNLFTLRLGLILAGCALVMAGCIDPDVGKPPPGESQVGGDKSGGGDAGGDTTAPAEVADFIAIGGDGQVSLSWVNPTDDDLAGVMIRRSTVDYPKSTIHGEQTFDGLDTGFLDTPVGNGTSYYYTAFAYDDDQNDATGTRASATPQAASAPPGAATGLTATTGDRTVSLTWDAPAVSEPVSGFKLFRDTAAGVSVGGTPLASFGSLESTYQDTAVTNETTYYYVVVTYNPAGDGPQSNEASATPQAALTVPGAPIDLTASAGDSFAELSWTAPTGTVSGYDIHRSTSSSVDTSGDAYDNFAGTQTTYRDTGVVNDTTYHYKVVAYNSVGVGPESNEASATPQAGANAGPDQTINPGDLVTLDGSGSSDADLDTLTYLWSLVSVPGGSSVTNLSLSDQTVVNPTFTTDVDGAYVVQLVVNDGELDSAPESVTITATPGATGVVYVKTSADGGDDANPGTATSPKLTIPAAIAAASPGMVVHVAAGTYNVNYQSGTHVVMAEGISIYGGYSAADWNDRDPVTYTTTITDQSATGGTGTSPNRAVYADASITTATVIDGFTINGGGGDYSSGIYNDIGSPTISNNTIDGGNALVESFGIFNDIGSPTITNNTINGGNGLSVSYGIFDFPNSASPPMIINNKIIGGSGNITKGIMATTATIINNIIDGGNAGNVSDGIYIVGPVTVENNIIFTSTGSSRQCIREDNSPGA
ncbi:MAG: fibronectin type III domain-containing protein, partial [SAR324 cluster bacterium]|nr:fibronectin type III domain-containing protein [SAR324 cluster bacterium]